MEKIRVLMLPELKRFENEESGIRRVVEAWHRYADYTGVEYVDCEVEEEDRYDIYLVHAGTTNRYPTKKPVIAALHGLYWTSDYSPSLWELKANENVIESVRRATVVTVPSSWVAESLQRDARIDPITVPHGIDIDQWEHSFANNGFILWNKNRNADVCNPAPVGELAARFSGMDFVTTFAPAGYEHRNIKEIGLLPHRAMKVMIQKAAVYLSTTKETFGIGVLEALASGVPVLGFAYGGNLDIVEHGKSGYLARPGDYDDLAEGLRYCIQYRNDLSYWAREAAKMWTWEHAMNKLSAVYSATVAEYADMQRPMKIPEELYRG